MEKLASLVLNGQGQKLEGFSSEQSEIQSFLDNVPQYMVSFRGSGKISREIFLRVIQKSSNSCLFFKELHSES